MGKGVISMASRTAKGVREVVSKAHENSSPKWSAFREKMGDLLKRGAEKAGIGAKAAGRFIANKTKDFSSDFRAGYHAFMVSYDARHMDKLEARIMEAREFRDRAAGIASFEARKVVSPDFAVHASDLGSFDRRSMAAADVKLASRFWEDALKASADLTMRPEDDVANKTPQVTMDEIAAEIKAEDTPAVKSPSAEQGKFSFSKAAEETKALSLKGLDGLQLAAAQFSSFIDRVKSGELDSTSEDFRKNVDQATTMMRRLASLEELGVADGASAESDLGVDFDG